MSSSTCVVHGGSSLTLGGGNAGIGASRIAVRSKANRLNSACKVKGNGCAFYLRTDLRYLPPRPSIMVEACSKLGAVRSLRAGYNRGERNAWVLVSRSIPSSRKPGTLGKFCGSDDGLLGAKGVRSRSRGRDFSVSSAAGSGGAEEDGDCERPPFDLNLAVLLAGFAFESYNTPQVHEGMSIEKNSSGCETYYLSNELLKDLFLGRLEIKVLKASNIPAMDLWGTSDPYATLKVGESSVQTKTVWKTLEPVWNEKLSILVQNFSQSLQVALWDANVLLSHRRMGIANIPLYDLCDGEVHHLSQVLTDMGGGGIIDLEIQFKTFQQLEAEQQKFKLPNLASIIFGNDAFPSPDKVLQGILNIENISVSDFMKSTFGRFNSESLEETKDEQIKENSTAESTIPYSGKPPTETSVEVSSVSLEISPQIQSSEDLNRDQSLMPNQVLDILSYAKNTLFSAGGILPNYFPDSNSVKSDSQTNELSPVNESVHKSNVENESDESFRVSSLLSLLGLGGNINSAEGVSNSQQNVDVERDPSTGYSESEREQIESSTPPVDASASDNTLLSSENIPLSVIKKTESILGSWVLLGQSQTFYQGNPFPVPLLNATNESSIAPTENQTTEQILQDASEKIAEGESNDNESEEDLSDEEKEIMSQMLCNAESAVEAWALLTSTLGKKSFVKSEFEKILFLNHPQSDTQVAIWRDLKRKRLVFAFRGTEQARIQDIITDISILPTSFDAERSGGGNFAEDPMVHSGFLKAYDSVRQKLFSFVRLIVLESFSSNPSNEHEDEEEESHPESGERRSPKDGKWRIYVTGHSLGGALATLFSKELMSSSFARLNVFELSMYNFGSPRVGNRKFVDDYNRTVKNSWRVVNRRDIIPTVPKLMGYCHVCCPVYLTPGNLKNIDGMSDVDIDVEEDGYKGDVLLETTPDLIFTDFMNGERRLVEKLIQVEIGMLQCLRDGSALKMHMEDFYFIALLKRVEMKISTKSLSQEIKSKLLL